MHTLPLIFMLVFGQSVAAWVYASTGGDVGPKTAGLGWEIDGQLVSGFAVEGWNGQNLLIHQRHDSHAPPKLWFSIADYCFNRLGCERITGMVPADNEKALKLNRKIGFIEEARLSRWEPDKGDMVVMVLWKKDCRFLGWEKRYG